MLQVIKNLYRDNALYLAVFITVSIAFLSLFNIKDLKPEIDISNLDKYEHAIAYLILTLSWCFAMDIEKKYANNRFWIMAAVFLFGVLMEVFQQLLTSYREADLLDIFANSSGIILGFLFFEKIINKEFKEYLQS